MKWCGGETSTEHQLCFNNENRKIIWILIATIHASMLVVRDMEVCCCCSLKFKLRLEELRTPHVRTPNSLSSDHRICYDIKRSLRKMQQKNLLSVFFTIVRFSKTVYRTTRWKMYKSTNIRKSPGDKQDLLWFSFFVSWTFASRQRKENTFNDSLTCLHMLHAEKQENRKIL